MNIASVKLLHGRRRRACPERIETAEEGGGRGTIPVGATRNTDTRLLNISLIYILTVVAAPVPLLGYKSLGSRRGKIQ